MKDAQQTSSKMGETRPADDYAMSAAEVADALGIAIGEVYDRLKAGVIPGHKAGRHGYRWVILRREFERWREGVADPPPILIPPPLGLEALVGRTLSVEVNGIPLTITVRGVDVEPIKLDSRRGKEGK